MIDDKFFAFLKVMLSNLHVFCSFLNTYGEQTLKLVAAI